jgi:hypothetical protein
MGRSNAPAVLGAQPDMALPAGDRGAYTLEFGIGRCQVPAQGCSTLYTESVKQHWLTI